MAAGGVHEPRLCKKGLGRVNLLALRVARWLSLQLQNRFELNQPALEAYRSKLDATGL